MAHPLTDQTDPCMVTDAEIRRAREAQARDRAEVLRILGPRYRFTEDGRLVLREAWDVRPWGLSRGYSEGK